MGSGLFKRIHSIFFFVSWSNSAERHYCALPIRYLHGQEVAAAELREVAFSVYWITAGQLPIAGIFCRRSTMLNRLCYVVSCICYRFKDQVMGRNTVWRAASSTACVLFLCACRSVPADSICALERAHTGCLVD